ncbi:MAG TPA: SMP-30/gluconolactonase/LRE family protein, partial [Burkholderiales bacterium]|nr:SMP-30/gluconolactonase/LRE family protein [Burkholderiales bacterium]
PDGKSLYVAEGDPDRTGPRQLRAYPIQNDGSVGKHKVLHEFGAADRGIEGLCVSSEGNVFACGGWKKSGPGPMVYLFSPAGELVGQQPAPDDLPMRCAFGDPDLSSLYLTNGDGYLYRARHTGHKGGRR